MIKNKPIGCVFKMIGLVLLAAIIGMLLLWMVYLLPTDSMAKNVAASKDVLVKQDDSQFLLAEDYWKAYDLGTNIIMLHEIIIPSSGDALQDSLLAPTADYIARWKSNWTDVLIEYATDREYGEDDYVTYARYWHGYLVVLKPLFMFMDLQGIYILNGIVLMGLSIWITCLLKKRIGNYWIPYVVALLTMNPLAIVQSFQLSTVFYATQITMLLLLMKDNWKKEELLYIFVIDGVILAFLDFLTYPLVAFAFPVLTSILLDETASIKNNLIKLVMRGIAFGVGYAGMWGMKWVLATLFTRENVIMDAIESVLHRAGLTESEGDANFMSISIPDALQRNMSSYFNELTLVVLVIAVVLAALYVFRNKHMLQVKMNSLVVCGIMFLSPFVWIMILHNHASLHPHLEWRTFAVLTYSIGVFVVSMFSKGKMIEV